MPVARAGEAPLLTLDSGPVAGVTASMFLGAAMGEKNIITTDMGGTSFDVSIIYDGKPAYSFVSNTDQYEYFLPKVDLQAIGAGGGSLVRANPETRTLTVGPDSAGAFPGPVCYGRGGRIPTVTDAQLVLGYLDPDNFAGGRMKLDREAAFDCNSCLGKKHRADAARDRRRRVPHRRAQHGRRDPQGDGREGLRPARLRAVRLRRRRARRTPACSPPSSA